MVIMEVTSRSIKAKKKEKFKFSTYNFSSFFDQQISNVWLIKFIVFSSLSSIECKIVNDDSRNNLKKQISDYDEVLRFIGPMAQIGFETTHRRTPRDAFDRGYQEFLKNYYEDHSTPRRSYYYYRDSNENGSKESSDDSSSDSNGNSSEEHKRKNGDKTKNFRNTNGKGRNKNNNARQHHNEPKKSNKKKSKHCKSEKRGNMMCSVCYDPKNDEKSESCSFNKDTKYSTNSNDNTSREDSRSGSYEDSSSSSSKENDDSSSDESEQKNLRKKPHSTSAAGPYQRPNPVHYPFRPFSPFAPRNVGPQVFPPVYSPYPRYDLNNLPPNYALIRYTNSLATPYGRTFRFVTPPNSAKLQAPPQNNKSSNNNRLRSSSNRPISLQDMRPPRDINGAHSESRFSNVTKQHRMSNEYPSNHPRNHATREYSDFVNRDWASCEKSIENQQICFECHVDGGMKKECMYSTASKPQNYFKSYSTTHTYKNKYHPYEFETPDPIVSNQPNHKQKNYNRSRAKSNNNHNDSSYYSPFLSLDSSSNVKQTDIIADKPLHLNIFDFNNNDSYQRPQAQPLRSATDIIYGIRKPGAEPMALFFKMDHRSFEHSTDKNNDNNNNKTNIKSIVQ